MYFNQQHPAKPFYEDDISDIYSFEDESSESSDNMMVVDPQGAFEEAPSAIEELILNTRRREAGARKKPRRKKINTTTPAEQDQRELVNSQLKVNFCEDYFNPFLRHHVEPQSTNITSNRNPVNTNVLSATISSKRPNISSKTNVSLSLSPKKIKSNAAKSSADVLVNSSSSKDCGEVVSSKDYFDPFARLTCDGAEVIEATHSQCSGVIKGTVTDRVVNPELEISITSRDVANSAQEIFITKQEVKHR